VVLSFGRLATCGSKRRRKTPQPSQLPSRLFPLSDMSVIPSAWDSYSGDGCNLQESDETSKFICAAMLVFSDPSTIVLSEERIREARQAVSYFCRHNSSWPAPSSLASFQRTTGSRLHVHASASVTFRESPSTTKSTGCRCKCSSTHPKSQILLRRVLSPPCLPRYLRH
jgi:hypothetical protein